MKIAFFTEGYDPFINGVVTSLKTLQSVLAQRGHEVVIFAPSAFHSVPLGSSVAIGQTMVPHKALRENSTREDEEA